MKNLSKVSLLLSFFFAAFFPAAVSAAPVKTDPAALYKKHCGVCHGEKGDGQSRAIAGMEPKPTNFTDPNIAKRLSKEGMIKTVREGVKNTAMVGWKGRLSEDEIAAVVDYTLKNFVSPGPAKRSKGAELYTTNCAVCHGEHGDGQSRASGGLMKKPRNFTAEATIKELTRERMIFSATFGVPNSPMVGFKGRLTEKDIETVVDYVRKTFMRIDDRETPQQAHKEAEEALKGADMSLPFPNGLAGNASSGGKFYKSNCYVCHGWFGDGNGPRSKFIYPKPRDFGHPASLRKYNRPALFKAIGSGIPGTEMPAWDKVLTDQQIADVAEYVFQTFIKKN